MPAGSEGVVATVGTRKIFRGWWITKRLMQHLLSASPSMLGYKIVKGLPGPFKHSLFATYHRTLTDIYVFILYTISGRNRRVPKPDNEPHTFEKLM